MSIDPNWIENPEYKYAQPIMFLTPGPIINIGPEQVIKSISPSVTPDIRMPVKKNTSGVPNDDKADCLKAALFNMQ